MAVRRFVNVIMTSAIVALLVSSMLIFAIANEVPNDMNPNPLALLLASKSGKAKALAAERYHFLDWFQSQTGRFPLEHNEQTYNTLLFPLGRSDRAYVLLLGGDSSDLSGHRLWCYQRTNGKYHRVYKVNLTRKDRVVSKGAPAVRLAPTSLWIYLTGEDEFNNEKNVITDESYPVKGTVSQLTKIDLKSKRRYVPYNFWFGVNLLQVSLLSDCTRLRPPGGESYCMDQDPITKKDIDSDVFYRKYGLPPTTEEILRAIR